MSHTITIRVHEDLARWIEGAAKEMGVSKGRLIREQLERAREGDLRGRRFMHLAGVVRGAKDLSTRKGFSKA